MKKVKSTVVTDPIADMLTRVRNAIMARHDDVMIPASKTKLAIAKIMADEGYVTAIEETKDEAGRAFIRLTFKLSEGRQRVIQGLRRISKPGLRVYAKSDDLPKVLSGLGIAIVSTSKGIMTDKDAREKNLGGEVLAYIW
ncbi:MAG: 30S ribosomal protein S8 [Firmicutes bacterium]|nr:30S ribosomal protein S8 [Bacillota bacterium]